jgi:nucleoside phosphorylase
VKTKRSVAVFLTALPVEYKAVRAYLTDLAEEKHPKGTIYERGLFHAYEQSWQVGIVEVGPGNEGMAMEVERACNYFQPDVVFLVGIGGGIKDVKIGDIVAATKIYGYESGSADKNFLPRPNVGETSYEMEQRARAEAKKAKWYERIGQINSGSPPKATVGPIAAGEKVVKSKRSSIFKFLRTNYGDALAVEMEGRGFVKTARANMANAMVIRGISDLIDEKEEADASGSQELAARNAAAFAFEMLANIGSTETSSEQDADSKRNLSANDSDWWERFRDIIVKLYPRGAEDNEIWARAGGDISMIDVRSPGKASWFTALSKLQLGGGGHSITIEKLLSIMLNDFPNNEDLRSLKASHDQSLNQNRQETLDGIES